MENKNYTYYPMNNKKVRSVSYDDCRRRKEECLRNCGSDYVCRSICEGTTCPNTNKKFIASNSYKSKN